MNKIKKIIIGLTIIIVIIIIAMIVIIKNLNNNQELIELQKIATKKYFEECIDVKDLYLKTENTYQDVNEPQFVEIQLKLALDKYFKENAGAENAPAGEIKSLMWNPQNYPVDFVGTTINGYTYNIVEDTFSKETEKNAEETGTEGLMNIVEEKLKGTENQEIQVSQIEKTEKNKYVVHLDLLGYKKDLKDNEENPIPEENQNEKSQEQKEIVANSLVTVETKDEQINIINIETKVVEN